MSSVRFFKTTKIQKIYIYNILSFHILILSYWIGGRVTHENEERVLLQQTLTTVQYSSPIYVPHTQPNPLIKGVASVDMVMFSLFANPTKCQQHNQKLLLGERRGNILFLGIKQGHNVILPSPNKSPNPPFTCLHWRLWREEVGRESPLGRPYSHSLLAEIK